APTRPAPSGSSIPPTSSWWSSSWTAGRSTASSGSSTAPSRTSSTRSTSRTWRPASTAPTTTTPATSAASATPARSDLLGNCFVCVGEGLVPSRAGASPAPTQGTVGCAVCDKVRCRFGRFVGPFSLCIPFALEESMSAHPRVDRHGPTLKKGLLWLATAAAALFAAAPASASEAQLVLPDLSSVSFLGLTGRELLMGGLFVCLLGMLFGLATYVQLKNLPVHRSMREISELIFETCKTYLVTQGKFILILEAFIGAVMVVYFWWLRHFEPAKVVIIVLFSLVGIAGSYGVAWFGIRINTFANSRSAFASLRGKPFPTYEIPLKAGISIGMLLI